ncbi:MAG: ABC transporter substrate-binding protein [Nitrospinota bacterium]
MKTLAKCIGSFVFLSFLFSSLALAGEKLNFSLDWIIYAPHTYMISAKKLGYYKKAGLDVDIRRGYGSSDTIKRVGAGEADFGMADTGSLIVARDKGVKAKELGVFYARAPYELLCLDSKKIRTPKDVEGKIMGTNKGTSVYTLFPAFAEGAGINPCSVKWTFMQPTAIVPSLVAKRIDCAFIYSSIYPIANNAAKKAGTGKLNRIAYADYGVDIYANGLITQDGRIAKNPDQVRAMTKATFEGVAFTLKNPTKAMNILLEHSPSLNRKNTKEGLEMSFELLLTPDTRKLGIGYMSREKVTRTRDVIARFMKLKKVIPVDDIYTMKFLPKILPVEGGW